MTDSPAVNRKPEGSENDILNVLERTKYKLAIENFIPSEKSFKHKWEIGCFHTKQKLRQSKKC